MKAVRGEDRRPGQDARREVQNLILDIGVGRRVESILDEFHADQLEVLRELLAYQCLARVLAVAGEGRTGVLYYGRSGSPLGSREPRCADYLGGAFRRKGALAL